VGSLFEDTREAVRKSRKANKEKRLAQYVEEKLGAFGLLDFFRFSSFSKGIIRLLWQAEGLEIPISEYSYRYECRVSNDVLKRAFAWKRFKLTVPLPYTDKEWKDKILQASNGNVEPVGGYPLRRKNNRYELRCLRCSLQFSKARLFNKKHSVIRCPECDSKQDKRYSKEAIRWLEDLEKRFGLSIRKGTSPKGEYAVTLDGKTSKVDGYSKKGNMVFEYHGSRWHGNPLVFYLDETPQFRDKGKSTKQLLVATLKREEQIQKLGFNLIRIWDQDFLDEGRYSQWLLRNSKRIQKFLSPQ
jgi:DNA-directed RNA polymerase subunit RPC12/RpoP